MSYFSDPDKQNTRRSRATTPEPLRQSIVPTCFKTTTPPIHITDCSHFYPQAGGSLQKCEIQNIKAEKLFHPLFHQTPEQITGVITTDSLITVHFAHCIANIRHFTFVYK